MITVICTRAVYIAGTAYPEGAKVKLTPAQAWEAFADGYARFVDPDDAPKARDAFVTAQNAELARLNGSSGFPSAPWRLP